MFESLTDKMGKALRNLRGVGKITEDNVADTLKEIRAALLSADVHFKVVKEFTEAVKEEVLGTEVLKSVSPGQQMVKIINDQLVKTLGEGEVKLSGKRPLRIMLVGLHGAGKTTTAAKLALHLRKKGFTRPALVACDVYRPAAIDQLETLSREGDFLCYADRSSKDVARIAKDGEKFARKEGADLIIFDTAGRLQVDNDLIDEVKRVRSVLKPEEVFLVADSALGQEAFNVAKTFNEAVGLTGIVLTKLDGDARGGAALSMKTVTGVPIAFAGIGERMDELETFYPDRMASRILGMGDVVSLVEKVQDTVDEKEAERMAEKLRRADFNLEDFLKQMRQVKKMGSLGSLVKMMPGMSGVEIGDQETKRMARTEAIILSMTPHERQNPHLLNGSRRMRVAKGSGLAVRDVNQLLKQFTQMKKMMKKMQGSKGKKMMKQMESMGSGGNLPGGFGR